MSRTKQTTINVGEEKIVMRSYARTNLGNPSGFYVTVSDGVNKKKYFSNTLKRTDAENNCYSKFVKEFK
jgi:hypothetical protein